MGLGASFAAGAAGGGAGLAAAADFGACTGFEVVATPGLGLATGPLLGIAAAGGSGDAGFVFLAVPAFGVAFEAALGVPPFLGPANLAPVVAVLRAEAVLFVMWASTARTCSASPTAGLLATLFRSACVGT